MVLGSALDPAGAAARDIDDLWRLLLVLGVAVFALFAVLLAGALRRARRDHPATDGPPGGADDVHGTTVRPWLLGGGVVLPVVVVIVVLVATVFAMRATADEAPGSLVVDVTGHQFWWEIAYPDHGVTTANEVHVPAGEPVTLVLRSADVIHSFWVPALAGKLDALPDGENRLVIEAGSPGRYQGACAEFCGLQHANMNIVVVAHEPADFAAWLEDQAAPAADPATADAREGREVFAAEDCGSCHRVGGTSADGGDEPAPDLTHLASRETIAGGVLELTPEALGRWLADPHEVKEGTSMPDPELSDADVAALVAYLEGLR